MKETREAYTISATHPLQKQLRERQRLDSNRTYWTDLETQLYYTYCDGDWTTSCRMT